MTDVKRYTHWCEASHGHAMLPDRDGMWVMAMDYDALRAERDSLERQVAALTHRLKQLAGDGE